MSNKLTKKQANELLNQIPPHVTVGTTLIDDRGRLYKITKIKKTTGEIEIGEIDQEDETPDHSYGTFKSYTELMERYNLLDKPLAQYEEELTKELANGFASFKPNEEATSTDVVLMSGKDKALEAQRQMEAFTNKLAVLTSVMERKRYELSEIKDKFQKSLKNINRVIGIIELYLGVNAQIEQIREGEPASEDTPISFRQLVLHMDEEVALEVDIEGGLDFYDVDIFDKYAKKFTDTLIPEKKGVVILRPRRKEKDYGDNDPFADAKNAENRITYILIRNGKNLYRIRTPDLNIYPRLFPSAQEMQKLTGEEENQYYRDREKNEEQLLGYKRNALFLQGLIDRTEVFKPHRAGLNLFKMEEADGLIKFIYDADGLGDGRKPYHKWMRELNDQLQRGDRIYFAGGIYNGYSGDRYDRYEWEQRFPQKTHASSPHRGVYNIKRIDKVSDNTNMLVCHYNPKDTVYKRDYWKGYEMKERTKAVPFRLYYDDDFLINYEKIKIEDIDYYLRDRVNRQHYLKMMPVLKGIKKMLLEEKVWEDGFVEMVVYQTGATEKQVRDAIEWWKRKVIEKRPLTKEDAKAVRMITKYLKSGDTGEAVE